MVRIDKYLADCMIGTRSEIKKMIKNGRVKINDQLCRDAAFKFDENIDEVYFDGNLVVLEKMRYFMLNKPAGCVSATKDKISETVLGFLAGENVKNLFPVGRLDKDTEGLLLITNDGALAHELLSPKKHVDKTYFVIADEKLSKESHMQFEKGVDIGDEKPCLPAVLEYIGESQNNKFAGLYEYRITIHEGRYHQIKRMFEACQSQVVFLKRLSMGNLVLDENLAPGEYKKITLKDIIGEE